MQLVESEILSHKPETAVVDGCEDPRLRIGTRTVKAALFTNSLPSESLHKHYLIHPKTLDPVLVDGILVLKPPSVLRLHYMSVRRRALDFLWVHVGFRI